jgi:hypothetical protein
MRELAAEFDINRMMVSAHLRRARTLLRRTGVDAQQTAEAVDLSGAGWSSGRLAGRFNVRASTIFRTLRQSEVSIRPPAWRTTANATHRVMPALASSYEPPHLARHSCGHSARECGVSRSTRGVGRWRHPTQIRPVLPRGARNRNCRPVDGHAPGWLARRRRHRLPLRHARSPAATAPSPASELNILIHGLSASQTLREAVDSPPSNGSVKTRLVAVSSQLAVKSHSGHGRRRRRSTMSAVISYVPPQSIVVPSGNSLVNCSAPSFRVHVKMPAMSN